MKSNQYIQIVITNVVYLFFLPVTDKTIQRSILFAAGPQICHYPITVINSFKYMTISTPCDLIATTPGNVSYFAIAMHSNQVFYAKDDTIFSQNLFGNVFVSNFSTRNKISGYFFYLS